MKNNLIILAITFGMLVLQSCDSSNEKDDVKIEVPKDTQPQTNNITTASPNDNQTGSSQTLNPIDSEIRDIILANPEKKVCEIISKEPNCLDCGIYCKNVLAFKSMNGEEPVVVKEYKIKGIEIKIGLKGPGQGLFRYIINTNKPGDHIIEYLKWNESTGFDAFTCKTIDEENTPEINKTICGCENETYTSAKIKTADGNIREINFVYSK
jgi:hypothetical protein